jgi:hypothetical protein
MKNLLTLSIIRLLLIMITIIISVTLTAFPAYSVDYDDDTNLDFIWEPAIGPVDHYNVYASIDDHDYMIVGETNKVSYTLSGADNHKYRIKVQAVDAMKNVGPMSEGSDPVICRLVPWDVNRDGLINASDLTLVLQHFGQVITEFSAPNPDVNGDGIVNILDLVIIAKKYGG